MPGKTPLVKVPFSGLDLMSAGDFVFLDKHYLRRRKFKLGHLEVACPACDVGSCDEHLAAVVMVDACGPFSGKTKGAVEEREGPGGRAPLRPVGAEERGARGLAAALDEEMPETFKGPP